MAEPRVRYAPNRLGHAEKLLVFMIPHLPHSYGCIQSHGVSYGRLWLA